jgi:hypothetical protein
MVLCSQEDRGFPKNMTAQEVIVSGRKDCLLPAVAFSQDGQRANEPGNIDCFPTNNPTALPRADWCGKLATCRPTPNSSNAHTNALRDFLNRKKVFNRRFHCHSRARFHPQKVSHGKHKPT